MNRSSLGDSGKKSCFVLGLGCSCSPALGDTVTIAQIKNIGADV